MTLEERVARLEQRIDQLDRIEQRLEGVEDAVVRVEERVGAVEVAIVGLRSDFNGYRVENGAVLGRILATLEALERRPAFRWPWETLR